MILHIHWLYILFIFILIIIIILICSDIISSKVRELWSNTNNKINNDDIIIKNIVKKIRKGFPHLNEYIDKITIEAGEESYTTNKKAIRICCKNPKGKYYSEDMLTHVLLHELAHVLNVNVGHGSDFQKIDGDMQSQAKKLGLVSQHFSPTDLYCPNKDQPHEKWHKK